MPLCERFLGKGFCAKCHRMAAACLCVTAIGAHDVPHTDPEPVHMPMPRVVDGFESAAFYGFTLVTNKPPAE